MHMIQYYKLFPRRCLSEYLTGLKQGTATALIRRHLIGAGARSTSSRGRQAQVTAAAIVMHALIWTRRAGVCYGSNSIQFAIRSNRERDFSVVSIRVFVGIW